MLMRRRAAGSVERPAWGEPRDLCFVSPADGSEQRYVELLPEGFDEAQAHHVLVAFHGHGADRWQYVKSELAECRAARDFAAGRGMIFVSPDYRASTSWMGPAAEADTIAVIEDVRRRHAAGEVFLTGASMGGASVLTFAARHPQFVAGVSSQNGIANHVEYGNFQEAIAESFGGTRDEVPEEYEKRSPELRPEALTMPVAFTTGGRDASTPPASIHRLAAALERLGRKVLLIHREDGGHCTIACARAYSDCRQTGTRYRT